MDSFLDRRKRREASRLDEHFASKTFTCLLYTPGLIALAAGFLFIATGLSDAASPYLIAASLITLLSGSVDACRRKIIRQDEVIRELQERLETQ